MSAKRSLVPEKLSKERLAIEYSLIQQNAPTFDVIQGDLTRYRCFIPGIDLYEGGFFQFEITLPRAFPYDPPEIRCMTRIWHPQIDENPPGRINLPLIYNNWTPSLHIFALIGALELLLINPVPDDPLNSLAACQMKSDYEGFVKKAKEYTATFARRILE